MLKRILTLTLILASATFASAKSYTVKLQVPTVVAGTQLDPGSYKVDVEDSKVVIRSGRTKVETQAAVESSETRFSSTSVRYKNGDGKYRLAEIRLGGTNTRLVFN
ncbi:MAG: hypothetical protein IPM24_05310 [Bryobacterales bacterium]|nr:hypothetical protein [Bryobacterales bacterium]